MIRSLNTLEAMGTVVRRMHTCGMAILGKQPSADLRPLKIID